MIFKNPYFKPFWGEFQMCTIFSTVDLPLSEAAADVDHARGYTLPGKLVDGDTAALKVKYTTGFFYGIMARGISLDGVLTDAQFLQTQRQTQVKDPPLRRGGENAYVLVYHPGSLLEWEGSGIASLETNVVTSGTGALTSGSTRHTELSCIKGGWRAAQSGEFVMGILDALPTPEDDTALRIRVQLVSPYLKA